MSSLTWGKDWEGKAVMVMLIQLSWEWIGIMYLAEATSKNKWLFNTWFTSTQDMKQFFQGGNTGHPCK